MLSNKTGEGGSFSKVHVAQRLAGDLSAWWEVASICPCIISCVFFCFLSLFNCLYLNPQVFLAFALLILSPIMLWREGVTIWGLRCQLGSTQNRR